MLLHGCCHNPTGIDFSRDQWREIAETLAARKLVPFIDLAYQGLGDGLDEDAWATRLILESVDEALVAYSCDKNFGVYRDRVGALYVLARDARRDGDGGEQPRVARAGQLVDAARPRRGGGADRPRTPGAGRDVAQGARRRCATRINGNRAALAEADPALAFIRDQRGLFSNLCMSKPQAAGAARRHAIYCADSGRINRRGHAALRRRRDRRGAAGRRVSRGQGGVNLQSVMS